MKTGQGFVLSIVRMNSVCYNSPTWTTKNRDGGIQKQNLFENITNSGWPKYTRHGKNDTATEDEEANFETKQREDMIEEDANKEEEDTDRHLRQISTKFK
mmetsp:Transcript_44655/g.45306  ORF Transcript_44655/g.45306 Transcript_44655/m.45306 type:complete len:100 (+) Transcript_44655:72-371(+)